MLAFAHLGDLQDLGAIECWPENGILGTLSCKTEQPIIWIESDNEPNERSH
jgi:hypothetical protein